MHVMYSAHVVEKNHARIKLKKIGLNSMNFKQFLQKSMLFDFSRNYIITLTHKGLLLWSKIKELDCHLLVYTKPINQTHARTTVDE